MSKRFSLVVVLALFLAVTLVMPSGLAAREGGDLDIALNTDPESLDPVEASSSPAATVMLHSLETLFDMTEDMELEPLLAEDYEISEDGLEYDLYLREGVYFHDGHYFDAEVVKYNIERLQDEEAVFSFLVDPVQEIEVVDDYHARLHLDEPFAPLLINLSHDFISMISPDAAEEAGDDDADPVGTGPFEFVEWTRGEEVVLERYDDYWGDNAYLDTVTFNIVPEDSTRVVQVETGEADVAVFIPPYERERLEAEPDVEVVQTESLRTIYAGFHTRNEPFDDVRVRQAFNYAIDKEAIVEQILEGAGRPSDAPIAPGIFGYSEQEKYEYNPERAQELLAEAGYEDGLEITFHHPEGRYTMDATIAQAIQSQLADVGVEAQLETMEWTTYLDFLERSPEEAEHEMYLLGWGTVTGDADYGLYSMFHSSEWAPAGSDYTYLGHEEVDELLEAAQSDPGEDNREEYYAEATEIIWEEAPWLFLHRDDQMNAVRDGVEGIVFHPREQVISAEAYFAE